MKILVIGATGKMGKAVVAYLTKDPEVKTLGLLDVHENALQQLVKGYTNGKLKIHPASVDNKKALIEIMKQYNVAVVTLPNRRLSYLVMNAAIEAQINMVDILEEYHRRPDKYETEGLILPPGCNSYEDYGEDLHERALKNEVLILDGMGFAPGLSNLTTAHGISLLDSAETAIARVGGIPNISCYDQHPLRYMTTWSLEHVLREYNIKTLMLRNGELVEIQALNDKESFKFQEFGIDVDLECAITPGMPSFVYTHPNLKYFAEKTIRWPGHYGSIQTLTECGLLDETPIEVNGVQISPRTFLLNILNPKMLPKPGEGDVCVMYNTIEGMKNGSPCKVEYFLWDEAVDGFSAMARVTSFPSAIGAKVVASGKIDLKGIRAPEECIIGDNYEFFLNELKKSNIFIKENISQ